MRLIIATAAVAATLVGMMPSQASAWYCVARSASGARGWATSNNLARARYNALVLCAACSNRHAACIAPARAPPQLGKVFRRASWLRRLERFDFSGTE
jgi:hypothetical protein